MSDQESLVATVNTPTYQLADHKLQTLLGTTLSQFLISRREGHQHYHPDGQVIRSPGDCEERHSHRLIAYELYGITGIDASHEACRNWYALINQKLGRTPDNDPAPEQDATDTVQP